MIKLLTIPLPSHPYYICPMYIPTQKSTTPMFLDRENNSTHTCTYMEKLLEESPHVSDVIEILIQLLLLLLLIHTFSVLSLQLKKLR